MQRTIPTAHKDMLVEIYFDREIKLTNQDGAASEVTFLTPDQARQLRRVLKKAIRKVERAGV